MISTKKPSGFNPRYNVVSCFLERDDKILLVLRLPNKSEGGKWGVPAGKIDPGETPLEAIIREIKEETAITIASQQVKFFKTYYVRYPEYDFVYHVFHAQLPSNQEARIKTDEHQAHRWTTPQDALEMLLVTHLDDCIKLFYG
jgi:8-oxo-dGTP diphosphatase